MAAVFGNLCVFCKTTEHIPSMYLITINVNFVQISTIIQCSLVVHVKHTWLWVITDSEHCTKSYAVKVRSLLFVVILLLYVK